jgi:O-antigen ligase
MFQKKMKWYFLIALLASLLFMLYSGSRTFLVAVFLAFTLFLVNRKTLIYLLTLFAALVLVIIYRFELHQIFKNTILEQFTSLVITVVDNSSRLSRLLIWRSWWYEIQQFTWFNFLVGKTYIASTKANLLNIHFGEWFHNDFLSITFAYGVLALILYLTLFYKIYHENSKIIRKNIFLFLYFFAMLFSAFFNGFYYYFPIFLIFTFLYMVRVEKKALRQ